MTSRQRLLKVLRGETPDRVPVSPFVQDDYLAYYYPHKTTVDRVSDAKELADELDFDLIAKPRTFEYPHFFQRSYPHWEVHRSQRIDGQYLYDTLEIITPKRTLVQEKVGPNVGAASAGIHKATTRYLLNTKEDVEAFLAYMPELDPEAADAMQATAARWRTTMGERGILAPWVWAGVFNFACELRDIESLMMAPYEEEDEYAAFMGQLSDAMAAFTATAAATDVECIGIQGNMANSAVMSPDFFREYVQPYEQKTLDAAHRAGKHTVYHNCGYATRFYPNYREMGMTLWETVSAAPQGDNDLAIAKAALGDTICLLGNLDQVAFLKSATPEEVAARTRATVAVGKPGGRYIFSTSDFLERDTPRENVIAMIETAKAAGHYIT